MTAGGFRFLFKDDYDENKDYTIVENNKKSVTQLDINKNYIKSYNTITLASKELNLQSSHISSCCKGKRKTTGGFKFMYLEDYNNLQTNN